MSKANRTMIAVLALFLISCVTMAGISAVPTQQPTQSVSTATSQAPSPTALATAKIVGNWNVRAGPGTQYSVVCWLYDGDVVTVLASGIWANVKHDNCVGYIYYRGFQ